MRKGRIAHEAFRLFCLRGIDRVTIRDIAVKAGVAEKSIYRYFSTKPALVIATISMLWAEIVTQLIASIQPDYEEQDGLTQVGCLLGCFRHLFENHAPFVLMSYDSKLFLSRHGALMTEEEYRDELQPIQELYLRALEKGKQDGSIAARADSLDLYFAIWGLMRGYVFKIVVYDQMYGGTNLWRGRFDLARSLILNGLTTG